MLNTKIHVRATAAKISYKLFTAWLGNIYIRVHYSCFQERITGELGKCLFPEICCHITICSLTIEQFAHEI